MPVRFILALTANIIVGVLGLVGAISYTVQVLVQVCLVAFILGAWSEAAVQCENSRREAVTQTERFIRWGHWALNQEEEVPDARALEQALSASQEMLAVMDRAAPWWVKIGRRVKA